MKLAGTTDQFTYYMQDRSAFSSAVGLACLFLGISGLGITLGCFVAWMNVACLNSTPRACEPEREEKAANAVKGIIVGVALLGTSLVSCPARYYCDSRSATSVGDMPLSSGGTSGETLA